MLSITTQLAAAALGTYFFDMSPPAEKKAMSTLSKSNFDNSEIFTVFSPQTIVLPNDFELARPKIFFIGNCLSFKISNIVSPTWPVAPQPQYCT